MYTNFDKVILSLLDFSTIIRDTIEYGLDKTTYSLEFYEKRKKAVTEQLEGNSQINQFLANNKEKGEELKKKLEELKDMIYSENSTICQVGDNELRVDKNQAVTVFDLVLPVEDELLNIVYLHLVESSKHQEVNKELDELYRADEKMYRVLVWFALVPEVRKQFHEFNKLMNESKGKPTPQSNFITQDISKLHNYLVRNKEAAKVNTRDFTDVQDRIMDLLDILRGKKVLREGHTIQNDFNETLQLINAYLQGAEKQFNEKAQKAYSDFFAQLKEEQEKAKKEQA